MGHLQKQTVVRLCSNIYTTISTYVLDTEFRYHLLGRMAIFHDRSCFNNY